MIIQSLFDEHLNIQKKEKKRTNPIDDSMFDPKKKKYNYVIAVNNIPHNEENNPVNI